MIVCMKLVFEEEIKVAVVDINSICQRVGELLNIESYNNLDLKIVTLKSGPTNIVLHASATSYRPYETNSTMFKLKTSSKLHYVSFTSDFYYFLHKYGIKYKKQKDDTYRVDYQHFVDFLGLGVPEAIDLFEASPDTTKAKAFLIELLENAFSYDIFACCGHFKECSEIMKCICQDTVYSLGCSYRKHIMKGNNFLL